ncbi:hydantoinase/oxoprolinase family protein [Halalkalicoccus ordinarius]|uniref:hydantoinase/oxoprolinase family protein n=1 Tax=Halalkalicoccus ordinarius TaxID=3116651 RepID=UPI00300F168A
MADETRIGVDVGGTFTDVALYVGGDLVTAKVPSTTDQSVGVMDGIEKACETAGIPPDEIDAFSHAMTVSVNALLERGGARTALVTTAGFRDVLEIGRQARPDLYDLNAEKPDPLVPRRRRYELDERATPDGIETAVDEREVRELAREIEADGAESVAVCLLHAYANDENERAVAEVLREELSVPISVSSEVLAEFREFERASTTAVDAYVTPAIDRYVGRLAERTAAAGVPTPRIMQSNGGTAEAETVREHAVTTVLSGPAAGVVGADAVVSSDDTDGGENDLDGLVTFDMGGTSSDVSLVREGEIERTTSAEIDGLPIGTPMVDVNTVGAGGGSIAWVDAGGALRVGPRSAGADPGPACYGKGGERATVTDANVVLGYIGSGTALGGELSLDVEAAHAVLDDLAAEAGLEGALEAARGVYRVANANMTRAVRAVTVERGYDPRGFGLVAFGGAGPMHAAALADALDVETVVVPLPGGVLSAFGLLAADEKHDAVRTHRVALSEVDPESIESIYADLQERVREESATGEPEIERAADLRYVGQSFELTVPVSGGFDAESAATDFHAAHERTYGYRMDEAVELVNLRTSASVAREAPAVAYEADGDPLKGEREAYFPGTGHRETSVYDRERLAPGERIEGPAVLEQSESTAVVPPEWGGRIGGDGTLVCRKEERR